MDGKRLSEQRLREILATASGLPVAVVGDLMLDRTIRGDVHRISPEAPVPVVSVESESWVPGGAANVALNLVSLGARAELCGSIGKDAAGKRLTELLRRSKVAFQAARWRSSEVPTIEKTRVVVRGQQLCRLDREADRELYGLSPAAARALESVVARAKVVILSDYAKGVLVPDLVQSILVCAKRNRVLVAVDAKPGHELPLRGVDVFKCNRREAVAFAGLPDGPQHPWKPEEVCRRIHAKFKPLHLVITLGADGLLIATKGRVVHQLPTVAREVFDVCGAGDTAIAALSLALAGGASIEEAGRFANAASAVVVAKSGTATVNADELLASYRA